LLQGYCLLLQAVRIHWHATHCHMRALLLQLPHLPLLLLLCAVRTQPLMLAIYISRQLYIRPERYTFRTVLLKIAAAVCLAPYSAQQSLEAV
jgi:hypothetical protein